MVMKTWGVLYFGIKYKEGGGGLRVHRKYGGYENVENMGGRNILKRWVCGRGPCGCFS